MKKVLFGILTFLGIGLSFCSADGVYRNQNSKLISVVINGQTKYTLQDRNLGATCMNVNDSCSYGNYYQRGNNYGFGDGTYQSSNGSTNLDGYGPGNYFNSNGVWYSYFTPLNANAWGFASGTFEDSQGPCSAGYNVPQWTQFISDMALLGIDNGLEYQTYLFFPYAGLRLSSSNVADLGVRGLYWSNRLVDGSVNGFFLHDDNSNVSIGDAESLLGMSIRCMKNEVVEPTYKRTRLTGDVIEVNPTIIIYYNNGNSSEEIDCDGTNTITVNGLSTITSTNTFTPYYNISYRDEDNQSLIESYSKDILYLENGQFKKTYTGNNDWILSVQGNSENSFSGYLPTFEITGGINESTESGNIFNNFAENSVKFAFSNIPSYIQYVLMFALLMLILGLVKPFKRRR